MKENAELQLVFNTEVTSEPLLGFVTSFGRQLLAKTKMLFGDAKESLSQVLTLNN